MASRIQVKISGFEHHRPLRRSPAQQRPEPGDQHGVREWLGQVVVGTAVEGTDLVRGAIPRGEHQDRRPDASLSQLLTDLEAVDFGQHQVEHDGVVRLLAGQPQAVGAVERHVDGEAIGLQPVAQAGRQPLFVLDHEHTHAVILPHVPEDHLNPR